MRSSLLYVLVLTVGCSSDRAPADSPHAVATAGQAASARGAETPEAGRAATAGTTATQLPDRVGGGSRAAESGRGAMAGATGASGARATAGTSGATAGTSAGNAAGAGRSGANSAATQAGKGPAQTQAVGYGKAARGGGDRAAMKVDSLSALQAAVDAYAGSGGLVLEYTGKFDFGSIPDPCTQHTLPAQKLEIKKKSDVTILGAEGSAANFGIHVSAASKNIVIRNMTIGLVPGGGDSDMISLEGMSGGVPSDIWIDHNELFSSLASCPGAGDTAFDGMIDIKKGGDNVTISYNYLHDHHKACLNGYSDSDDAVRHVTFHHNLFENIGSRAPLQRHGYAHIFNNHFSKVVTSGINVRMGGYALVEANYFENVLNPVTSRDSSAVGFWDLRKNNLASQADVAPGNAFGITWDNGSSGTVNATDWTTTMAFPDALGYGYDADPFDCVHDGLRAVAGSGKSLATLTCK